MISCDIIRDLLLLYASDECSQDSKKLIEEHIETCESCRKALEELRGPVVPQEEPETRTVLDEKAKDFKVKRVFKKIRRRWLASLLCVLLIFPLIGAGFMVRNQIEGEGVCFTNLDELYTARAFVKAVQKGNYEKAFSYIDAEGMYEEMTVGQLEGFTDWDARYFEAEIGGETYYVDKEVYLNEYAAYLEDKDEARFWESIMIYNSTHSSETPIPEDVFAEAAALFEKDMGVIIVTDETEDEILNANPDYNIYDYYYSAITSEEGDTYYYLSYGTNMVSEFQNIFSDYSKCLPKAIFEQFKAGTAEDYARVTACAEYYKDMGLETYTAMLKEDFFANMQELEDTGVTIKSFSFGNIYSDSETGRWEINIALVCEQDGNRSDTGGIDVHVKGGKLRITGCFYSSSSEEEFLNPPVLLSTVTSLLSLNEDPADLYGND